MDSQTAPAGLADPSELDGQAIFCSWSGGKDSTLALHEAIRAGARPVRLLSMLTEGGERSRSHGIPRDVLEAQAAALGIPIAFGAATWAGYEEVFGGLVEQAVADGARIGVFGDIDLEEHRDWEATVCARAGAAACLPLWLRSREQVVDDVLGAGFRTVIVAVRADALSPDLLGRELDAGTLEAIGTAGADLAGENGEYHSLVVDGPIFRGPIALRHGERSLRDGLWFLDVALARTT